MFSQIKNKLQLISGFLLLIFSTYYLSKDNGLLGFFADDGNTLYVLLKNITFFELIDISIKWDAARDLHLIWQKFFILMSEKYVNGDSYIKALVDERVDEIKNNKLAQLRDIDEKDLYNVIEENSPFK